MTDNLKALARRRKYLAERARQDAEDWPGMDNFDQDQLASGVASTHMPKHSPRLTDEPKDE